MAVDPGEKNIGIAISDPGAILARPLTVIKHQSLKIDCGEIARLAKENEAVKIIIGQPMGEDETIRPQMRHAQKLAETLSECASLPVELWDEYSSTSHARKIQILAGISRKKRAGHLDDLAAAVILQSYLDFQSEHEL